jgi:hypothetical protein
MNSSSTRRSFLRNTATASSLVGLGGLSFLSRLPRLSAQDVKVNPKVVQFSAEIEPLVRFIEDTPRERLLEEAGTRVQRGLSYRELLAALSLAGVRNIQPRPVGFKFHAVLVVNSAHLASMASPDSDRWLPIFWALDQFKNSQAQDVKEGDWTMSRVDESAVPPAHKAKEAFIEAMDNWDVTAADAAVAGLARSAGAQEVFEIFCRYGARDFRDLGHKAIYVSNSWRLLQTIGWQHAEPVLRSLAYAILEHEEGNPAQRDAAPDRPGRRNQKLISKIKADWQTGKPNSEATSEMLKTLRQASDEEAAQKAVELLNNGAAPQSIWDAIFNAAGELLMRQPGIATLHSVTAANAFHFAYQTSGQDETRRMLLLQNASFIPVFRARLTNAAKDVKIDELEAAALKETGGGAVDEILADISRDRMTAARKVLTYLKDNPQPTDLANAARRQVFLKGTDSHDYKFSSAVLEDYQHLSTAWRNRYLAASVFWLKGSGGADSNLVKRTRAALKA